MEIKKIKKDIIIIISKIENLEQWNKIKNFIEKEESFPLKILIELESNFLLEKRLDIGGYFHSFLQVKNSSEIPNIIEGLNLISNSKGAITLKIDDLKSVSFKTGKEIFFKKSLGENIEKIIDNFKIEKPIKNIRSIILSLKMNGNESEKFKIVSKISDYFKEIFNIHDILFSISEEEAQKEIYISAFFSENFESQK